MLKPKTTNFFEADITVSHEEENAPQQIQQPPAPILVHNQPDLIKQSKMSDLFLAQNAPLNSNEDSSKMENLNNTAF